MKHMIEFSLVFFTLVFGIYAEGQYQLYLTDPQPLQDLQMYLDAPSQDAPLQNAPSDSALSMEKEKVIREKWQSSPEYALKPFSPETGIGFELWSRTPDREAYKEYLRVSSKMLPQEEQAFLQYRISLVSASDADDYTRLFNSVAKSLQEDVELRKEIRKGLSENNTVTVYECSELQAFYLLGGLGYGECAGFEISKEGSLKMARYTKLSGALGIGLQLNQIKDREVRLNGILSGSFIGINGQFYGAIGKGFGLDIVNLDLLADGGSSDLFLETSKIKGLGAVIKAGVSFIIQNEARLSTKFSQEFFSELMSY